MKEPTPRMCASDQNGRVYNPDPERSGDMKPERHDGNPEKLTMLSDFYFRMKWIKNPQPRPSRTPNAGGRKQQSRGFRWDRECRPLTGMHPALLSFNHLLFLF